VNGLWYTARGAGLCALIVLTVATVLGAGGASSSRDPSARVILQYVHRTAAVTGFTLVLIHVTTIVTDSLAHVSVAGALIPFAAQYRPNAVALGSISAYLLTALIAAALARGRFAQTRWGSRIWRPIHVLTYPLWALAMLHGALAGTDRSKGWVILIYLGCALAVLGAVSVRVIGLEGQTREPSGRLVRPPASRPAR